MVSKRPTTLIFLKNYHDVCIPCSIRTCNAMHMYMYSILTYVLKMQFVSSYQNYWALPSRCLPRLNLSHSKLFFFFVATQNISSLIELIVLAIHINHTGNINFLNWDNHFITWTLLGRRLIITEVNFKQTLDIFTM